MNHTSTQRLSSLAHPLIVSPARGIENGEERLSPRQLPFPHIDLSWEGFTIPHLHWVGVKLTDLSLSEEIRRVKLTLLHENCHKDLARTPFSLFKKRQLLILYYEIVKVFTAGREQIPVPLNPDESRNELEKQWCIVDGLIRMSELVEEV